MKDKIRRLFCEHEYEHSIHPTITGFAEYADIDAPCKKCGKPFNPSRAFRDRIAEYEEA